VPLGLGLRLLLTGARGLPRPLTGGTGITSVTIALLANGGDNLGTYVPLFATLGAGGVTAVIVIFLVMTALWCVLARHLAQHPALAQGFQRYGSRLLPLVLILLGLIILMRSLAQIV
ncbi:MAG TPA: cadmium resistance transporter, partial [Stellaceae bacterium]|nr:cadmium resistance transporter [Stellaceae bacterium]